ncbi:MAG: hypothetical protein EA403_07960 [Spirochaetaceae bacterium]|nr:MAG: hypothetical protein EA403_07960 [Spirochaetaceae bacterium]
MRIHVDVGCFHHRRGCGILSLDHRDSCNEGIAWAEYTRKQESIHNKEHGVERDQTLTARRWGNADSSTAVVLLHGFGADYDDLVPLGRHIDPEGRWDWHFPRAPVDMRVGGVPYGRAWFPDQESDLMQALTGHYFQELESIDPDGLRSSGAQIADYCRAEISPTAQLVLGGFSQGAMVSVEACLQLDRPIRGVLLCSGAVIAAERTERQLANREPLHFVQAHGTEDAVLEYRAGVRLFDLLKGAGWNGRLITFTGGHTIPSEALVALEEMMETC